MTRASVSTTQLTLPSPTAVRVMPRNTATLTVALIFLASRRIFAQLKDFDRFQMAPTDPVTSESACNSRTVVSIIFSCLATIALCIWASIHPNVPDGDETTVGNIFWRLKLSMFALIAPELVIAWAVRQQFVARNLMRAYKRTLLSVLSSSKLPHDAFDRGLGS